VDGSDVRFRRDGESRGGGREVELFPFLGRGGAVDGPSMGDKELGDEVGRRQMRDKAGESERTWTNDCVELKKPFGSAFYTRRDATAARRQTREMRRGPQNRAPFKTLDNRFFSSTKINLKN
jgi:hypothetical protein